VDRGQATDAATVDGALPADGAVVADVPPDGSGPSPGLRRCPTSGRGGVPGEHCFLLTPAEAGLPSAGTNATVDQYALRPAGTRRSQLLLFLNGSGGAPRGGLTATDTSFYSVARSLGHHVLAVSYRSDDTIASLCAAATDRDGCFLAARATILAGVPQPGAPAALLGIAPHEGVYARVASALSALDARDPTGGWGAFYDRAGGAPERMLRWGMFRVSGHSQGGGHAAFLGRLHAVDRVLLLAAPCDNVRGTPAAWLTGGGFATDPATRFWGLGAPGDTTCSTFAAAWEGLGMAPAARMADAALCTGEGAHSAPIHCAENAARWTAMLQ
jgi:hypothetical protein